MLLGGHTSCQEGCTYSSRTNMKLHRFDFVLLGMGCRPSDLALRFQPTSYKQAVQAVRELQASCTLDVKGSGYCGQHTRQSLLSTYNGSGRSVILQGTQPNGCSHLTRVVMLPFHEIRRLPALTYISDLNVTPFTRYTGYPRWYTFLTYKVT